ncbi:MAG: hypothetical protein HUJ56_09265, partial [Erysipelotrichaceae bacterium]|nr:hypothetical protein [Erysipelotrichaceae bacterium]
TIKKDPGWKVLGEREGDDFMVFTLRTYGVPDLYTFHKSIHWFYRKIHRKREAIFSGHMKDPDYLRLFIKIKDLDHLRSENTVDVRYMELYDPGARMYGKHYWFFKHFQGIHGSQLCPWIDTFTDLDGKNWRDGNYFRSRGEAQNFKDNFYEEKI